VSCNSIKAFVNFFSIAATKKTDHVSLPPEKNFFLKSSLDMKNQGDEALTNEATKVVTIVEYSQMPSCSFNFQQTKT